MWRIGTTANTNLCSHSANKNYKLVFILMSQSSWATVRNNRNSDYDGSFMSIRSYNGEHRGSGNENARGSFQQSSKSQEDGGHTDLSAVLLHRHLILWSST